MLWTGNTGSIDPEIRKNFTPVKDSQPSVENIFHAMYDSSADACAFQYIDIQGPDTQQPESDLNVGTETEAATMRTLTPSMTSVMLDSNITSHTEVPLMSEEDIKALNDATVEQHESSIWRDHRVGRITASRIHAVKTRMKTVNTKPDMAHDVTPLVKRICEKPSDNDVFIEACNYGISTEGEAMDAFKKKLTKDGHTNVRINRCGLIVHPLYPYIAASPDGIITCDCCSDRVLEVKCPLKCLGKDPNQTQLSCLSFKTGKPRLKINHEYYDQILTQMAVTDTEFGEFVVYSRKGMFQQTVPYNDVAFLSLVRACQQFFDCFVTLHYRSERMKLQQTESATADSLTDVSSSCENIMHATYDMLDMGSDINVQRNVEIETSTAQFEVLSTTSTSLRRQRKRRKIVEALPVYICKVCEFECIQRKDIMSSNDFSVQCDNCKLWYHQVCVDFNSENVWMCPNCHASS